MSVRICTGRPHKRPSRSSTSSSTSLQETDKTDKTQNANPNFLTKVPRINPSQRPSPRLKESQRSNQRSSPSNHQTTRNSAVVYSKPSATERIFAVSLVYQTYKLTVYYFAHTMSLWIRIRHVVSTRYFKIGLMCCLNISVHYLGPQELCSTFCMFTDPDIENNTDIVTQAKELYFHLIHEIPADHLPVWKITRNIQWFLVLKCLKGRL